MSWPAASLKDIESRLCAEGEPFEMETVAIRGVATRVWKHQPASLKVLAELARDTYGERLFVIYEDERVTYEAWFRAVAFLAGDLHGRGIGRGDRVAIAMRNLPEWPVAFFAVTCLGAIAVPLNAWWTGQELHYGLAQSGTSALIADPERWERIRPHIAELPDLHDVLVARAQAPLEAPARALESVIGTPQDYARLPSVDMPGVAIEPDDEATIFYTSGTTGSPKGALGTHRNILTCTLAAGYLARRTMLRRGEEPAEIAEPSIGLVVVPMFHVTACNATLMATIAWGGTMVFMRKWDVIRAFELIERERITFTGGVPTIAWQLLEHPDRDKYDLRSLKAISYGGAPAAPALVRRIGSDLAAAPGMGWGMTETSATVTSHSAEDYQHRPESCGPALPVSDLKIMDEDAIHELPLGEAGELWARGPQIVKGYWNNPEATATTFVNGWVRTGDIAKLDEEGFCTIIDRAKDVVIRAGENIYSIEVENALYDHPAVSDAALVGVPHRTLGEEPAAVVHLSPGMAATEAELKAWVGGRLAGFKVPVRILFTDATLPRNANGKILKKTLRTLFDANEPA